MHVVVGWQPGINLDAVGEKKTLANGLTALTQLSLMKSVGKLGRRA